MLRKAMAMVMVFVMLGTLLNLTVMAGDPVLSLKAFNATTSVITLDLDGVTDTYALDASSFSGRIQLFKVLDNGDTQEITDFTATLSGGSYANAKKNTIIVTPTNGVVAGTKYKVVLKAGIADMAPVPVILPEDVTTGLFAVTVLYSDNFNVSFDDSNNPIAPFYKDANDCMASYNWNASYKYQFTGIYSGTSAYTPNNKFTFRNNSQFASLNTTGLPSSKYVSDYTVEYMYGLPKASGGYSHRLGMRAAVTSTNSSQSQSGYGFGFTGTNYTALTGTAFVKYQGTELYTESYSFSGTTVKVRASTIGNNLQYFVDNDKIFDLTDTSSTAAGTIGFNDGCTYNQTPYCTVDDLVITKMSKIKEEISLGSLTIDNFDSANPKATINIKNTTNSLCNVTGIVAIYDSNKTLIDIKVSAKEIPAYGELTYDENLSNSSVIDTAKAFVFDNMTNIKPLCNSIVKKK